MRHIEDTKPSVKLFLVQGTLLNTLDWSLRDREGVLSEGRETCTDEYTSTQEYTLYYWFKDIRPRGRTTTTANRDAIVHGCPACLSYPWTRLTWWRGHLGAVRRTGWLRETYRLSFWSVLGCVFVVVLVHMRRAYVCVYVCIYMKVIYIVSCAHMRRAYVCVYVFLHMEGIYNTYLEWKRIYVVILEDSENIDPICYPLPEYISFEGTDKRILFTSSLCIYLAGPYTSPGRFCTEKVSYHQEVVKIFVPLRVRGIVLFRLYFFHKCLTCSSWALVFPLSTDCCFHPHSLSLTIRSRLTPTTLSYPWSHNLTHEHSSQ